jgi:dTDP-4-amino-4,6-dideoxygalactose transaminase
LDVRPSDFVLIPTLTFAATAFAATYLGAIPYFVDVEAEAGTMDPGILADAITDIRASGGRVGAAIPVDLYGSPADYSALIPILRDFDVPVLEDAAEGLGAKHRDGNLGSFGRAGVLSFNGNKILTTSGGGMLLTDDAAFAKRVSKWSTQSREPVAWYEHEEIGFNYRLSNVLSALGRSQMQRIDETVNHRRRIRDWYRSQLQKLPGVRVQRDPSWGRSNAWLTTVDFDLEIHPDAPRRVREALDRHGIESRPIWKPMHRQPVFADSPRYLTGVADQMYSSGLCLPSGPTMGVDEVEEVSFHIQHVLAG